MTSPVYFFTFYPSLIGFLVDLKTPKSPFEIKSSENCKAAIRHFSSQIKNHTVFKCFPALVSPFSWFLTLALPTLFLKIVTSFMSDPLENLSRSGDVVIEAENDHFLLSFALEVNNIRANYWWKEMKLKGTVTALIQQVRIEMKIKLTTDRNNSAPPELLVFNVERIEGIKVSVR